jgi:hypothetical protein
VRCSPIPAPARSLTLALLLTCLAGCAGTPPTLTILAALKCGPLIPDSYRKPVPGTPRPSPQAPLTAGTLAAALDGQTGQLDLANGRTADVIAITETCDRRTAEVAKALEPKRPWWKVW